MDKRKLLGAALVTLPVIAGGIVLASQQRKQEQAQQAMVQGYICPATGEELPCPSCCPLTQGK